MKKKRSRSDRTSIQFHNWLIYDPINTLLNVFYWIKLYWNSIWTREIFLFITILTIRPIESYFYWFNHFKVSFLQKASIQSYLRIYHCQMHQSVISSMRIWKNQGYLGIFWGNGLAFSWQFGDLFGDSERFFNIFMDSLGF